MFPSYSQNDALFAEKTRGDKWIKKKKQNTKRTNDKRNIQRERKNEIPLQNNNNNNNHNKMNELKMEDEI